MFRIPPSIVCALLFVGLVPTVSDAHCPHIPTSVVENRIYKAFAERIETGTLEQADITVADLAQRLEMNYAVPTRVDLPALAKIGFNLDTTLPWSVEGRTLADALVIALSKDGLAYTVRDNFLVITSEEGAAKPVLRTYDVYNLVLNERRESERLVELRDIVAAVLGRQAQPVRQAESAEQAKQQALPIVKVFDGRLIVFAGEQAHRETATLLLGLQGGVAGSSPFKSNVSSPSPFEDLGSPFEESSESSIEEDLFGTEEDPFLFEGSNP